MKIVIEYVIIENLLINFIVLKSLALVCKEKGRIFLLSAFLGSCLTVCLPLLRLSAVGHILTQIGLACVIICISFKFKSFKKFLKLFFCYFLISFAYGGAVYFFEGLFGQKFMILTLLIVTLTYFVFKIVVSKIKRKNDIENFCKNIKIENDGKIFDCKAFLDSGNLLTDPVTKSPVCLINFNMFSKLFDQLKIEDVLTKSQKLKDIKLAHYINFSTLNNTNKIFVFQVDQINVGDKVFERPILGLCFQNFNQSFGTDIILHNNFA